VTLVVSDISSLGIVMVGDSAVTDSRTNTVTAGAIKVQYSAAANVGFALWGNAGVDHRRIDTWLAEFISTRISKNDSVEDIGNRLSSELNAILVASRKSWADLVRGIHLAGFRNGLPVLFHVHCGHDDEPAHELRLYKDFPDNKKWSESHFRHLLSFGFIHLRNGFHPLFAPLFERAVQYAGDLRAQFNIQFPHPSLDGRLEFYKLLVRYVAGTLKAAKLSQGVNDTLSTIAFGPAGLIVDERLSFPTSPPIGSYEEFFLATTANKPLHPILGSGAPRRPSAG